MIPLRNLALCFAVHAITVAEIKLRKTEVTPEVNECFQNIIETSFTLEDALIVVEPPQKFPIKGLKNTILTISTTADIPLSFAPVLARFNYVIFAEDRRDLRNLCKKLFVSKFWDKRKSLRGNFLIIVRAYGDVRAIFQHFWSLQIHKVLIFAWDIEEDVPTKLYSGNPFGKNMCGKYLEIDEVDNCNFTSGWSPFATIKDFRGCSALAAVPTKFTYTPYLEISNCNLLSLCKDLNINVTLETMVDYLQIKMLVSGVVKWTDEELKKYDMCCFFNRYENLYERFDVTDVYFWEENMWFVMKPSPLPHFTIMLIAFSREIWICVLVCVFFTSLVFWALVKSENSKQIPWVKCFFWVLQSSLGGSFPIPNMQVVKMFLFIYMCYVMVINTCFQGRLSSLLTHPGFEKGVKNIDDLMESNITLHAYSFIRRVFLDNSTRGARLYSKSKDLKNSDIYYRLDSIVNGTMSTSIYKNAVFQRPYYDEQLRMIGHDYLLNMELVYALKMNSPYQESINELISKYVEAGLPWKCGDKILNHFYNFTVKTATILTLQHVEGAFLILCFGLATSTVVFAAEVLIYYKKKLFYKGKIYKLVK